jgi:hypothetical protein
MTMSTDGKQIEALPEEERLRQLRLRYSGAIVTLCKNELRVAASRIVAVFPLTTEQEFVEMARQAFAQVAADVTFSARNVRESDAPGG